MIGLENWRRAMRRDPHRRARVPAYKARRRAREVAMATEAKRRDDASCSSALWLPIGPPERPIAVIPWWPR